MDDKTKDINYSYTETKEPSRVEEQVFMPSTLENIDFAVYDFFQNLNISANSNEGFRPVPISWVGVERAYNRKDRNWSDDETFIMKSDDTGVAIYPAITIERLSIVKDRTRRGQIFSPIRGSDIVIARRIAQNDTNKFATADAYRKSKDAKDKNFKRPNKKVVYETITIPVPTYLEINYEIDCYTEYQQQMNDIVAHLTVATNLSNYVAFRRLGHSYEGFIDSDYAVENTISSIEENERKFRMTINIRVLGYIHGAGPNEELPRITKTQNAVEIKIGRERVILDVPNSTDKDSFYKS